MDDDKLIAELIDDFDYSDFPYFIGPQTQHAIRRMHEAVTDKLHIRSCRRK